MARKPIFALLIRAAAFLFCFFLIQGFSNTKPYDYIEHRMLDYRFCIRDGLTSSRDNSKIIPSDIVIVGIDESTRKDPAFKDYMAFWLDRFSKAIEAIEDQGATVITFDILHDAEYPAIYKDQNGSKGSMPIWEVGKEMLRNVLVESQVTVIPYSYVIGQPDKEGLPIYQKEIDTETAETKNIGTQKTPLPDQDHYTFKDLRFPTYMYPYYRHLEPQDSFDRKFTRMTIDENLLRRYGFINSNLDIDGVKRHAALIQNYGHFVAGAEGEDPDKENFYSIALTTYLMARNIPVSKVI